MATLDAGQRIIELAEGLLAQAESLNLSVAGGIARIYALVEDGDLNGACEVLDALDEAINAAREVGGTP
ncbi:MAG: hypothetical protein APF80_16745 [Alphaproteobacteria bacterium BRH_c36]|nr:MAG: hypothetical protein APF80_16745 [Alphaproteobacteria bacterium BRH_c36]